MVKDGSVDQKIYEALANPEDESNLRFLAFIASFGIGFMALLACFPDLLASIADGLYLSLSMLKYACGAATEKFSEIATDAKYDHLQDNWLQGPDLYGLILLLILLGILLPFSILANNPLKKTEGEKLSFPAMLYDRAQQWAQEWWPYVRGALSGLKNGRTAVISTIFIMQALAHTTKLYAWANPIGIGVGVICMANAIWLRKMDEERDGFIEKNKKTMAKIQAATTIDTLGEPPVVYTRSALRQGAIYAGVFGDGLTDGIYLYACLFLVIGLSTVVFPPAVLIAAVVTVAVMTVFSVISKLYDEHKKACVLELSALQPQIAYLEKKKELNNGKLSTEEEAKLASLSKRRDELSVKEDNKSLLFFAFRQAVMGFKNASAAGAVLLLIPVIGIPAKILFYLGLFAGALYAAYLARPVVKKYMASREEKSAAQPATDTAKSSATAVENKSLFSSPSTFFSAAKERVQSMVSSEPTSSTAKNKSSFFGTVKEKLQNVAAVDELRHFCVGS